MPRKRKRKRRRTAAERERSRAWAQDPRGRYSKARSDARRRGLEWSLSFLQYARLTRSGTCAYCVGPLCPTGSALDRKDNTRGYVYGNVIRCCGSCNRLKSNLFTYEEFILFSPALRRIRRQRDRNSR